MYLRKAAGKCWIGKVIALYMEKGFRGCVVSVTTRILLYLERGYSKNDNRRVTTGVEDNTEKFGYFR